MISVAIVIVHYKGINDTLQCLDSLKTSKLQNIKVTVYLIDNSPSKRLESQIKQDLIAIKYIKSPHNVGFAEGSNIGIRQSLKDLNNYILLLNSDTITSKDFLSSFIEFANTQKDIAIISPKIYFAPHFEYHKERYEKKDLGKIIWYAGGKIDWDNVYAKHIGVDEVDVGQYDIPKEVDFATGCCLLIKSEVIAKIGLFDKNYFVYFEDVDFSIRAQKAGYKVYYMPQSFIWHKNAASSQKPGSQLHVYFQTRNRLYFGLKYASWKIKLYLLKEAVIQLLEGEESQKKAIFDFFTQKMGRGSYNFSSI